VDDDVVGAEFILMHRRLFQKAYAHRDRHDHPVRYVVSDRAKALIKLAADGFGCESIPDLI
jgi:hypothetical protein